MIGLPLCAIDIIQRTKIEPVARLLWLLWRVALAIRIIVVLVGFSLTAVESDYVHVSTRISENSPKEHSGRQLILSETILICTATGEQLNPKAVSDGRGGAVVFWIDLPKNLLCKKRTVT